MVEEPQIMGKVVKKLLPFPIPKRPRYREVIALDTETNPDTGEFILAAAYGEITNNHGTPEIIDKVFYTEGELIDFLEAENRKRGVKRGLDIVFHNASFDMRYIQKIIDWNETLYSGTKVISAKTIWGNQIFDTLNFFQASLEKLIQEFNLNEEGIFKLSLDDLESRCKNDAKATWKIFDILQKFFIRKFGISIRPTIGATALKVFQTNFFEDKWFRDENAKKADEFERSAYYGGRTEIFRRGTLAVEAYDVNSMYPAVMKNEYLPRPNRAKWLNTPPIEKVMALIESKTLFILEGTLFIPDQKIPPLPVKAAPPGGKDIKLLFPVGEVSGVWCSPEVEAALKYGARPVKIDHVLYYPEKGKFFEKFVDSVYSERIRAKAEGKSAETFMLKVLMNSLYGKFGQRNGKSTDYLPLSGDEAFSLLKEGARVIFTLDNNGKITSDAFLITPPEEKVDSDHTFTCISAFITSYARVRLLEGMKAVGEENVVYCDTDSIYILKDALEGIEGKIEVDSSRLGAWKNEGENVLEFYRPKVYGEKMKGVPNHHQLISKDDNSLVVEFLKVVKRKESIKRGLPWNAFLTTRKTIKLTDDKREWVGNDSRPFRL